MALQSVKRRLMAASGTPTAGDALLNTADAIDARQLAEVDNEGSAFLGRHSSGCKVGAVTADFPTDLMLPPQSCPGNPHEATPISINAVTRTR